MTTKKVVTDEQLGALYRRTREFSDRVEKGVIPYDVAMNHLQAAFGGKMSMSRKTKKLMTLARAIDILGAEPGRVIQPSICARWGLSEIDLPIRYCEQALREVAESNKKDMFEKTDFHLVFFPGSMSLIRQRIILGFNSNYSEGRPSFSLDNDWWLAKEEEACRKNKMVYWPEISSPAGYYLLDMCPRFSGINGWQGQEEKIVKLGPQYERTPEDVFLFAALSIYMLTRHNVTNTACLEWCHWGKALTSDGNRVHVSITNDYALVESRNPNYYSGNQLVSVFRKS
jgi:hypothetical protein